MVCRCRRGENASGVRVRFREALKSASELIEAKKLSRISVFFKFRIIPLREFFFRFSVAAVGCNFKRLSLAIARQLGCFYAYRVITHKTRAYIRRGVILEC